MKKVSIILYTAAMVLAMMTCEVFAAALGTEGWDSGSSAGWSGNILTFAEVRDSGGNPDGYLYISGIDSSVTEITAFTSSNPNFTGDYGAVPINQVSFDLRLFSGSLDEAWLRFRYLDSGHNGWRYELTDLPSDNFNHG